MLLMETLTQFNDRFPKSLKKKKSVLIWDTSLGNANTTTNSTVAYKPPTISSKKQDACVHITSLII